MNNDIRLLCREVERTFGHTALTPRLFDDLSRSIMRHTGILLSPTTLKRIWGYLDEGVTPRRSTLDVLALYAGWQSFAHLVSGSASERESGVTTAGIDVARDLAPGDVVRLFWNPGRMCEITYLGDCRFRVADSIATRLQPDDLFSCHLIIAGEPLYLDALTCRDGTAYGAYVCGRKNGIRYLFPIPDPE